MIKVKCIEAGKWTVVRIRDRVNDARNVRGDKSTGVRQTTRKLNFAKNTM